MKKVGICFALVSVITVFCFIGGGCSLIDMLNNVGEEYTDNQEEDSDNNGENGANKNENVTKSVEITPRGMQTVIVGKECVFTANALREDGSIIAGKSVTEPKKFTETGKHSFSMTVDGLLATTTVNVIEDDITLPVEYMGKTYTGIDISTMTGSVENTRFDAGRKLEVTYPTGNSFDADGFFPLKLSVNNPAMHQFFRVSISGGANREGASYIYRGNPTSDSGELEMRIWLRWGKGSYTVKICDITEARWNYQAVDGMTSTDGKITYYGDNILASYRYYPSVTFTVNNTRDEDGTFLYPSSVVQSDDITVMNKAADLTAGLTKTEDKIKAIHDWIVTSKYYDQDSFPSESKRKRQDAVAVMEYGMCVCEGYANLTAALLRNCGIQTKFISSKSLNHAWNHVNVGTETNPDWRLLDTCWDDPLIEDFGSAHDGGPDFVVYENYLLENLEGGSEPHTGGVPDIGRTAYWGAGHIDGVESIAY